MRYKIMNRLNKVSKIELNLANNKADIEKKLIKLYQYNIDEHLKIANSYLRVNLINKTGDDNFVVDDLLNSKIMDILIDKYLNGHGI